MKIFARESINSVWMPWVQALKKADMRECFAWPHSQEGETSIFRLDDHVWIWKASSWAKSWTYGRTGGLPTARGRRA